MSDEIVATPIKKRRPRASEQEKAQWAERYYQSGLTQKQFAQQQGIADSTLQRKRPAGSKAWKASWAFGTDQGIVGSSGFQQRGSSRGTSDCFMPGNRVRTSRT